jgi:NADH dehydrogenase [ubiquinone] 1 alpha subcomplex assembly factor 1
MDRTAVKSIGIGILDNQYGPFKLEIDYIKVMVGDDIAKEMRRKREQEQVQENEVD